MNASTKKRLLRTLLLCFIAFAVGGSIALLQLRGDNASVMQKSSKSIAMPGIKIGGDFALIDHNGAAVTQDNYANKYKLIYFGFTYCPAICPTELQKISKVLKTLNSKVADQIQPLFITIDPQRDTPAIMRDYVDLFHPRLIGLSGSSTQIKTTLKNYRIFASKVPLPGSDDPDDYTMDHSSFIYLMSPGNQLISMYRIEDDVDYMLKDIRDKTGKVSP